MMKVQKNWIVSGIAALLASVLTVLAAYYWLPAKVVKVEAVNNMPVKGALFTQNENGEFVPIDFTATAEKVMDAVVHIKSTMLVSNRSIQPFFDDDLFREFFGPDFRIERFDDGRPQLQMGSGSGVIISEDGYIVTNYHVIRDAQEIEVTLHDNRTFKATVVGTDPSTDLAVLKIDAKGLKTIPFGNSDAVKVGEWVLAVGNPFNLNSTVTAGIVSAKARNIRILRDQYAVESFIQTDAAINPGNSGGALVNLQGDLIGINTAIASPTGAYAGYGFAVPSKIVQKVVEDILKYGSVQRAYLGVLIRDVDGVLAEEKGLSTTTGVYVDSLVENGAAKAAGIKAGDVIVAVDGKSVNNSAELQELIARHRPGDKVSIKVLRGSKEKELQVVLKSREGETRIAKISENPEVVARLGAELADLSKEEAKKFKIKGGVKVQKVYPGKLRTAGVKEGFIITHIDKEEVHSVKELTEKLAKKEGGVMIEGFYEDMPRAKFYYAFGL
ncbi:Do family serine endopeptidase [Thermonema sp.]|uniref:Do family serine endopeptidase n=1 Tax=Thermonema sp. TaxID=2231181 RepID=UPI00258E2C83|nr:Do family serine endopeptidase [Thermonema sp.]